MKKSILSLLIALAIAHLGISQSPDLMSYQMVVRDADNNLLNNETVGIKIEIMGSDTSASSLFEETHTITTNQNGLVSFEIGGGSIVSGNMSEIDWGNDTYFLKTSVDPEGGSDYTIESTSQMLSVPYAKHASSLKTDKTVEIEAEVINPEKTGDANLMPIAYGLIRNDQFHVGTDNIESVSNPSVGRYDISIEGENFDFRQYVTNATLTTVGFANVSSVSNNLIIFTYDENGDSENKDFYFVVYKP